MALPVEQRRSSGGATSRLAALTALSQRPSYSDSEATPTLLAEAPVFADLVFAKRPVPPRRGSTHAPSSSPSPRAAAAPLATTSQASGGGEGSRLTSPNLSAGTTRSVRTPSLCRSETSVGTSASDAAALASGAPSRCPSGGPTSPVAPNVSLLSAALLSEQAQCTTLRPSSGILVKDGAARTASQDRTAAHTSFAADSKPAHARFVEPVKPPRQSRRVSLPQPPAQHRESTSPDYMSEGCPAPVQKSILAPATVIASTAHVAVAVPPASPALRKRALMFQEDSQHGQHRAASRSALGLTRRTSRQPQLPVESSPETRTGWPLQAAPASSVEAIPHPCDVSPRLASPATLRDSPAALALPLASSASSPPAALTSTGGETSRSSLRFCGAAATEAARARTLKFASSPGEAAERRAAVAAATGEPKSKLFAPLARRATVSTRGEAKHPHSSDDEAPYVDAVADEAQRNVASNVATGAPQRRVVLVAAKSPRRSGERERKRVGRTCGSPAPARLSYSERVGAMRGARGGGSPAPVGLQDGYEEEDEYDDEEEEDDDSEDVDVSGSESESEASEEDDDDEEAQAQQEDGSASSCSSTGDIVTGTLMDEPEQPTSTSRPASRLQLTHFLPDAFDSSAPSSPTWGPARESEASATSSAVPSRSVSALTLPLARQPRNIPRRISTASHEASPCGSMSSGADAGGRLTPRSPPSPLMTLGRLPMHRSPLGRGQASSQRSLSSGAATRGTPSAAACSLLAAAGHGAVSSRSPTSGDDAWHRLRHYLDVGHSDGGESATALTPGAAAPAAAGAGVPRYFANPAQSRARSVPPGMAPSDAAGRLASAPASPNVTTTGYFGLLHHTLRASTPATDSETEPLRTLPLTPGARVLFSEATKRPGSSGGAQAPIRIARPAPNAQSKSDAELSGCAALRRAGLGGAAARRRAAASEVLASAGEAEDNEAVAAKDKDKEKRRRRRRTADAELAWGWGKARLGGAAPK